MVTPVARATRDNDRTTGGKTIITSRHLESALERHNRYHRRMMWLSIGGAVLLWALSYIFVFLVVMCLNYMLHRGMPDWEMVHLITAGVMVLLMLETIRGSYRYMQPRKWPAYRRHWLEYTHMATISPWFYRQAAFGLSEMLLCAPRCTLAALRHAGKRLRYQLADVERAVALLVRLSEGSRWHPVAALEADLSGLELLEAAGVLLHRGDEDGHREVRINRDACQRLIERDAGPATA